MRYAGLADQFTAKMGKKKRNSVESNSNAIFTGMTVLPGEEQRWEVWLHEQCAVWAAGVYMAGIINDNIFYIDNCCKHILLRLTS